MQCGEAEENGNWLPTRPSNEACPAPSAFVLQREEERTAKCRPAQSTHSETRTGGYPRCCKVTNCRTGQQFEADGRQSDEYQMMVRLFYYSRETSNQMAGGEGITLNRNWIAAGHLVASYWSNQSWGVEGVCERSNGRLIMRSVGLSFN
jgi:hypothetical protein